MLAVDDVILGAMAASVGTVKDALLQALALAPQWWPARSAVVETIKELQADEEVAGRLIIDLLRAVKIVDAEAGARHVNTVDEQRDAWLKGRNVGICAEAADAIALRQRLVIGDQ